MYYQIIVETNEKVGKSDQNKKITETDKEDKGEILRDIFLPYLNETEFLVNGYFLKKEDVIRLKIVTTDRSARELAQLETAMFRSKGMSFHISPENICSYDKYTTDVTRELFAEAKLLLKEEKEQIGAAAREVESENKNTDKTRVFIVHGRDKEVKLEVARFIEKMGFKPIILHEQVSEGMTIIEKIEKYSNVGFAVVLYTPCDLGCEKEDKDNWKYRARQNVVFEHGYLIGKLGRNNVCALVKQEVETPNDISGVVYIPFDENEGWKISLAKEMRSAGYKVDFNLFM